MSSIVDLRWKELVRSAKLLFHRAEQAEIEIFKHLVAVKSEVIWCGTHVRIDDFVKLEGGLGMYIGKDIHIASFCHIGIGGGLTVLEEGSCYSSGSKIISGSNVPGIGHGCSAIGPNVEFKRSFVHIKKNAAIFSNAVVLPGVTVGENAVVAAGSVVTKDIPDYEVWAGVPAERIKSLR